MSLLDAKQITVRFGGVVALRNVDVRQEANETLGMIGPNGSGKTTFVNVMTGHLKPAQGSLLFDGAPLIGRRPFAIAGAGPDPYLSVGSRIRAADRPREHGERAGRCAAPAGCGGRRGSDRVARASAIASTAPAGSLTLYEQRGWNC